MIFSPYLVSCLFFTQMDSPAWQEAVVEARKQIDEKEALVEMPDGTQCIDVQSYWNEKVISIPHSLRDVINEETYERLGTMFRSQTKHSPVFLGAPQRVSEPTEVYSYRFRALDDRGQSLTLVMKETGCTQEQATQSLEKANGDVVQAIMFVCEI